MGIFSKLKEIFSGKSIESLKEFEPEIKKLQKKSNSEIVALIGTDGRLKGLPLIYAAIIEDNIRRYTAQLTELMGPLKKVDDKKEIRYIFIRYENSILFYKPIMKNISFFAITPNKSSISTFQHWIEDKTDILREVFHSEL